MVLPCQHTGRYPGGYRFTFLENPQDLSEQTAVGLPIAKSRARRIPAKAQKNQYLTSVCRGSPRGWPRAPTRAAPTA
jgi:hypothetical protein